MGGSRRAASGRTRRELPPVQARRGRPATCTLADLGSSPPCALRPCAPPRPVMASAASSPSLRRTGRFFVTDTPGGLRFASYIPHPVSGRALETETKLALFIPSFTYLLTHLIFIFHFFCLTRVTSAFSVSSKANRMAIVPPMSRLAGDIASQNANRATRVPQPPLSVEVLKGSSAASAPHSAVARD